jgi:hypothetical protein
MSDLPSSILFQQSHARPKTGEELEVFGKQAASKYTSGSSPTLTEAVTETVKHAGLSPEQVKRVVEFANVDAYLQEFKKEGTDHKVIEFHGGPAKISEVLHELNSGSGGTVFDRGQFDYETPPQDVSKTASDNALRLGFEETKLAAMFQVEDAPLPYAEPLTDALDLKDKLASVYESLSSDITRYESDYLEVSFELFNQVKQAALSGVTLGQIVKAWGEVIDEPEFVKAAFIQLTPRLLENGVFPSKAEIGESLIKTASVGTINREHPVLAEFGSFCDVLSKLAGTRLAQEEIAGSLDTISTFLKHASAATTAGETVHKGLSYIPKAWKAITGAAERASVPVREFTEAATKSPAAAKAIGGAVKYAPHIGAGAAAVGTYQDLQYSPSVQALKNAVLSRIPYTQPYMMRQYEMARSMY